MIEGPPDEKNTSLGRPLLEFANVCTYVLMVLRDDAMLDRVADVLARYGKQFHRVENRHILRQLPANSRLGYLNSEGCDCGTAVGTIGAYKQSIQDAKAELDAKFDERIKNQLRAEKLEKWVAHQCQRIGEMERDALREREEMREEAGRWVLMLRDLIQTRAAVEVGLIVHDFSGGLESEKALIGRAIMNRVKAVTPEIIMEIRPGNPYIFHN